MKKSHLLSAFVLLGLSCSYAFADVAYVTSEGRNPWGGSSDPGSQESAMNTVFGADGWDNLTFQNSDASVLFSSTYTFVYLEGGDATADALEAFLTTNNGLIENWVSNGGRLFINAAPNVGDGMYLGFGLSLIYDYDNKSDESVLAMAADSSHVIFNGPYGTTGDTFTGNQFSHAIVAGNGLRALINGELLGGGTGIVLGEFEWGDGSVVVSGMTSALNQYPHPETYNLWANTLAYAAAIPEPSTYAIWSSIGLLGLVVMRRRR